MRILAFAAVLLIAGPAAAEIKTFEEGSTRIRWADDTSTMWKVSYDVSMKVATDNEATFLRLANTLVCKVSIEIDWLDSDDFQILSHTIPCTGRGGIVEIGDVYKCRGGKTVSKVIKDAPARYWDALAAVDVDWIRECPKK